jgi:mannose-6-phosphate isomerase-like protein (cupin superfamily)
MLRLFAILSALILNSPSGYICGEEWIQEILPGEGGCGQPATGMVISHKDLKTYGYDGNEIQGVATRNMGVQDFEVWRTSWGVGSATVLHKHETQEVFIFLKGKGRAIIGEEELFFQAPCTIICPANIPHQFFNEGDEPTDSVAILGLDSKIVDADGNELNLPWRK